MYGIFRTPGMLIAKQYFAYIVIIVCIFTDITAKAQNNSNNTSKDSAFVYDEIQMQVLLMEYKNFNLDVLYTNKNELYINIEDLFKSLKINCKSNQKLSCLNGFIENENRLYEIDYLAKQIIVGGVHFYSPNCLVKEMGALYIESSMLSKAFGISMILHYRSLSIQLKSSFELPIIKEQRIEKLRDNIARFSDDESVDTTIPRNSHVFKLGTIDWNIGASQTSHVLMQNNVGLGIGTELLFGEAEVSGSYYTGQKFNNRQLYYIWHWVDNSKSIIKQASVGRLSTQTISLINSPLIGAEIRNSPSLARKASGHYTIHEYTKPNWTIELYLNNTLVDFVKADASGLFVFKVPIVYGYTTLKLKFYGPLGEEHSEERIINVPYQILPKKDFEYSLSAGIIQNSSLSRFLKSECNYGVNRILSLGVGLEYVSSNTNGKLIPYTKMSIQPFNKVTCFVEFDYGVKGRILLDYYFLKDFLLEIDYIKYKEGQLVTNFNSVDEKKIKLNFPFRFFSISGYGLTEFSQFVYETSTYNQQNNMISFNLQHFSANISSQLNIFKHQSSYLSTSLSISYRSNNGYSFIPTVQYNGSIDKNILYKLTIEKRLALGLISIVYNNNVLYNDQLIGFTFKYDLTFVKTNISSSFYAGNVSVAESAQGSLAFKENGKGLYINNNSAITKGGIAIYPFLDLNQNGIFDANEHIVMINSVKIIGGKSIFSKKDSIVRIPALMAFIPYNIEFSDNDLDNIAWRFVAKKYQVLIEPNQFKRIDIPVISVGEVNGMVYLNQDSTSKGIGRILVKIYNKNNVKDVVEVLSESDGYISYLGLRPGNYVAIIDSTQMSNLELRSEPIQKEFTIKMLEDGDVVNGMDFVLENVRNR